MIAILQREREASHCPSSLLLLLVKKHGLHTVHVVAHDTRASSLIVVSGDVGEGAVDVVAGGCGADLKNARARRRGRSSPGTNK